MTFDLKNIDAVITDLDGTLYDKPYMALRLVLRDVLHLPYLVAERLARRKLRGQSFSSAEAFYDVYFREMAHHQLFSPAGARRWYKETYLPTMTDIIRRHYTLRPWVPQFIQRCKELNIPIVVYSDYDFVKEKLMALKLDESNFAFAVSSPSLGGLKPAKASSQQILNILGVKAERTLFIGDRDDTDGATARAVGAKFYLIQ